MKITIEGTPDELAALASQLPQQPTASVQHTRAPIEDICTAVSTVTGVPEHEINSRSHERLASYARHLAMYLSRGIYSQAVVATFFDRDHASVHQAVHKIEMELLTRPETAADLEAVKVQLA